MWRFWNGSGLKKRQKESGGKANMGHWIEEQKPKSVVRPGCSSVCGHQRATHDWFKRPRAQAPQSSILVLSQAPLVTQDFLGSPCSAPASNISSLTTRDGEAGLLSASPGTQGSPTLLPPRTRVPLCSVHRWLVLPPTWLSGSNLLSYRGICTSPR